MTAAADRLAWLFATVALLWLAGTAAVNDAPLVTLLVAGVLGWVGVVAWRGRRGAR